MKPTKNNVIVKRIEKELSTSSGIILKSSDEPDKAQVISIGKEVDEISVDDVVLINWNQATKIADETYVISIKEIIWIY